MIFDAMTWQEIAEVRRDILVVCPLGSTEQHGPHLPVGTDALIISAIACWRLHCNLVIRHTIYLLVAPSAWTTPNTLKH